MRRNYRKMSIHDLNARHSRGDGKATDELNRRATTRPWEVPTPRPRVVYSGRVNLFDAVMTVRTARGL